MTTLNTNEELVISEYSALEEKINISSHALGFILSIAALILLNTRSFQYGDILHIVSFSIFGASLIALYGASTLYHHAKDPELRNRLRILDHAAIYLLIAGTYTPFTLVTLNGPTGWTIFAITWLMAAIGITLKIYFTGKYDILSTAMYVFMGWIILFAIQPLIDSLSAEGLFWLVSGGIAYTVGAVLYSIDKIKFNHAIFHSFVLAGSACHFISVYFYVLPV